MEAHVVTAEEKTLQARTHAGIEQLSAGDALVTVDGNSARLPAWLFSALFDAGAAESSAEKD